MSCNLCSLLAQHYKVEDLCLFLIVSLARLGEAQLLLGQAIASSPFPGGLNAEQRKLYRAALADRAEPLYAEARETLRSADAKARALGVTGQCSQQVAILLGKVSAKPAERTQLSLAQSPVFDVPMMVDVRAVRGAPPPPASRRGAASHRSRQWRSSRRFRRRCRSPQCSSKAP